MKEIELLKIIFKDSPDILEPLNEIDKEIKRLNKRIEDLNIINEEHQMLNGKLREELEFEKATNKELLSTGADLENKLYEEQDKNKRLNNIIEEYKNANEYHQNIIHELETMKQPNQLYSENVKLRSENKRLNNIIGEAIEYIEERYNGEVLTHTFDKDNVGELLEILKGSDKE